MYYLYIVIIYQNVNIVFVSLIVLLFVKVAVLSDYFVTVQFKLWEEMWFGFVCEFGLVSFVVFRLFDEILFKFV